MIDWDDAFDNSGYVADADAMADRWATEAAAFRDAEVAAGRATLDLAYGDGPREKLDEFRPVGHSFGYVIFVHGGYWRMFDKSRWSHLARGALDAGWTVFVPSYPLAPGARIAGITRAIARAVTWVAQAGDGPLRLVGHSAGGHLVARMLCDDVLAPHVRARIARVVAVSGVHDLRPLRSTRMNAELRLTRDEAASESPVLCAPDPTVPAVFWVGTLERPEFLRQNRAIAEAWTRRGAQVTSHYETGRNHFDIVESLTRRDGPLTRELLR